MLLKEVTLEDLRQAARTGGLPDTPERRELSRGHPGIPAALSGIEPFVRTADGQMSGTAGQPTAERIMAAQRGRLNEFGQSLGEGPDQPSVLNLPQSMQNARNHDAGEYDYGEVPDDSLPDPMPGMSPPEVSAAVDAGFFPKTLRGKQAGDPEKQKKFARYYDSNMESGGPVRNREIKRNRSQEEIARGHAYGIEDSHLGEEYGPIVQNPLNYGDSHRFDPFPLENRIQTQEPVEDTEFADPEDLLRPLEGRNPAQMQQTPEQMQQLGQSLAEHGISPNLRFPEGVEQNYDLRSEQGSAQTNRARSLAAQSAQQSTASPMDAAMQALGNRKTEEAARVPKPVERRPLNARRGGRGRGPNSQRNRRRRR